MAKDEEQSGKGPRVPKRAPEQFRGETSNGSSRGESSQQSQGSNTGVGGDENPYLDGDT